MAAPLTAQERAIWQLLEYSAGADSPLDFMLESAAGRKDPLITMRLDHLRPLAEAFARSLREPVRMLFSVPPRHGKTELILHSCAQRLMLQPECQIVYASYSTEFARQKSKRAQEIAKYAGVSLRKGSQGSDAWYTHEGGYFLARGRGASITGMGANLLVVDDAFKNREEAESPVIRQAVFDWFTSSVMTRVEPNGSALVQMTRWHDDDLIGRLAEQGGWEYVNIPALDEGKALWPARWPVVDLENRRREVGEYDWASLYQGQPRPRGGRLFNDPAVYQDAFSGIMEGRKWRVVIGADPAATEKTTADFSVAVVMAVTGTPGTRSYQAEILDVYKAQIAIPKFAAKLVELSRHWNAPVACESQGGFKAVPQIMRMIDRDVRVVEIHVSQDKFTRALPVSAAWNDGRVRVPAQGALWLKEFLAEVTRFTGVKDARDDQVDALVHAFNALATTAPMTGLGVHPVPRDLALI